MENDQDIEEIRKKRQQEAEKAAQERKAKDQLKGALRVALDDAAYDRMMNISVANQDFYFAVARQVVSRYRKTGRSLTEGELLRILRAVKEQTDKKTNITFFKK